MNKTGADRRKQRRCQRMAKLAATDYESFNRKLSKMMVSWQKQAMDRARKLGEPMSHELTDIATRELQAISDLVRAVFVTGTQRSTKIGICEKRLPTLWKEFAETIRKVSNPAFVAEKVAEIEYSYAVAFTQAAELPQPKLTTGAAWRRHAERHATP